MSVCAYRCAHISNVKYVCAGVCLWKKLGQAWGRENNYESETETFFTYLFVLNVASWTDVSKKCCFYAVYNYEQ